MSEFQTDMERDYEAEVHGEPDVADTQESHGAARREESAKSINITGGNFKRPVFGNLTINYYGHQDAIVPPQQGYGIHGERSGLTDTLFVDVSNPISRSAHVYPGTQLRGQFCEPFLTAVKIVQYKENREREIRNLYKLIPHPNVVMIIYGDILPGSSVIKQLYIVMEQCQPLTLEEYIKNRKNSKLPFNTKQALDFAKQIISGMRHIHEKDIVHRDLKPSSVLFSLDGKGLKIIDFGVSKELENGMTTSGISTKIGTDGYRAPETYKDRTNENMKKPADVFSLGILLCHIWSYGFHPFGEDGTLWAHNIKAGHRPNLSKLLIPEPEKAKSLLQRMLKVNENERCTIADVEKHIYISQGVANALLSDMDNVWVGPIKVSGDDDSQPFSCKLYERKEKNILRVREQSAQFQMLYVPLTRMTNTLEGVVNVPPNGYLAVSKEVYLERLKKKFDRQMGWINALKDQDRIGAFIIFQPRGYEELVCIFIENPEEFLQRLRIEPTQENTVPKEPVIPASQSEPEPESEEEVVEETTTLPPTSDEKEQPAEPYNDHDATDSKSSHQQWLGAIGQGKRIEDRPEQSQVRSISQEDKKEEPSIPGVVDVSEEVEIRQPEYISWWLYTQTDQPA